MCLKASAQRFLHGCISFGILVSCPKNHCFTEFLLLLTGCSLVHILHWKLSFVLGSRPRMDALRLANSAFAVELFKQLCEKEPAGNILFSPICLSTSLSLAQVGAKGDTANEIGQVSCPCFVLILNGDGH